MVNNRLGNLEEMILLMIILVHEEAYGIRVKEAFIKHYNQQLSLSAVHTVLRRLEKKGFVTSTLGGASQERGGRRKRIYKMTQYGYKTLLEIQKERVRIWSLLPKLKF